MIVDCFPWFAPYGEELLVLRVNLLKDYVDKFVIIESDQTHSGQPVERKFLEIARKHGLPMEKIIYVEHEMPKQPVPQNIDYANAGVNRNNEQSVLNRVRERVQKDALMDVMDQFDDDDVFIYGDADEVIKPENIKWVANLCRNNQNILIKIPLVYLQGRADLRIHHKNGKPVVWWRAMFFATKKQIMKYTVLGIRSAYKLNIPVRWPTQNNKIIQDMGWHFAWMGNAVQRQIKADSFAHADDSFKWMEEGTGYSDDAYKTLVSQNPAEGNVAPDGNHDHILRRYPVENLPKLIFENQFIKDFLLPEVKMDPDFAFNDCKCYWCQKLEWPLMYDLDGDKVWFEIPRSCSVTVKETFPDRKQIFRDSDEYNEIVKTKKPIVIITDPVKRFISCINGYLAEKQRYYHYGQDIFNSFGVNLANATKQEKIDYFFTHLNKIVSEHQVHHFHPQVRFIDTQNFNEFEVIRRSEVNEFFDIDKVYNYTQKEITMDDLSEDQIDFIKNIYKIDYEFLEKHGKA